MTLEFVCEQQGIYILYLGVILYCSIPSEFLGKLPAARNECFSAKVNAYNFSLVYGFCAITILE
jgi:hypothetical protein